MTYMLDLDLSFNQLINFDDDRLFGTHLQVIKLNLNNNRIRSLSNDLFKKLQRLEILNLSSNFIRFIQNGLFNDLIFLKQLDLSSNLINSIEDYSFVNLNILEFLNLNNNDNLKFISNKTFSGLVKLKLFNLNEQIFDHFENVENLKLSINTSLIMRTILGKNFYQSINILFKYFNKSISTKRDYCLTVIHFARINIQLNLRTGEDFLKFITECKFVI